MTVPSEINRSGPYNGNGVTTVFDYDFRILSEQHLRVIKADAAGNETPLTLTTNYTVSGVGDAGGGSITVLAAPASGETITILRNMPFTQETDLENQGAYYAETVEDALDAAAMRDQQLQEQLDRAVMVPPSEDSAGGALAAQLARDITRLAQSADEIDTVASIDDDVTAVAGIAADVALLADVSSVLSGTASAVRMDEKLFTGNGAQTAWPLDRSPGVDENVLVWVGGAIQDTTDYSVSDTTLTIAPAVANGVEIRTLIMTLVTANDIEQIRDETLAARDEALAAASGTTFRAVADRAAMLALNTGIVTAALVNDEARGGHFAWDGGNKTADVTGDPGQIAVVPASADPTGASGAWIWRKMTRLDPRRAGALGALGDGSLDTVGGVPCPDDIVAMKRAFAWAAAEGSILQIDRPYRIGHTLRDENLASPIGPGQLLTASNQFIEGLPDGWIYPCAFSRSGSIITDLITQADAASIQENHRFVGLNIDMSGYKPFRFTGQAVSGDNLGTFNPGTGPQPATRFQLNAPLVGDPLPVGRGALTFYNYMVEIISGTGAGQTAFVKGYDEANKRFTINELWPITPDNTSIFRLGMNDNAYGMASRNGRILGGVIRNVPLGVFAAGGKAVNLENGPKDWIVSGVKAENVEGVNYFVQGHDGNRTNGSKRWAQNITIENCSAENGGALFAALTLDGVLDPDGDVRDYCVTFRNMWGKNVGHYLGRILTSDQQKSAAFIVAEAGPTVIKDITIDNTGYVPVYDETYPEQNTYGMSGPVGAIGIIWGRSVTIDGLRVWGDFDNGIMFQRWRAGGDDGGDADTPGVIQNTYRINIRNFEHTGAFTSESGLPEVQRRKGFLVSMNPWIGAVYPGTVLRPADIEVRINFTNIQISSDFELLPVHMASYTGVIFEGIKDWLQKTYVKGPLSADRLYAYGNTVAKARLGDGQKTAVTIGNNTVVDIIPPFSPGIFNFRVKAGAAVSSGVAGRVSYSVVTTALCDSLGIGTNVALGTTAMTNGTGNGVNLAINVAAVLAGGKIQMKNRMGASQDWEYWFE